MSGSVKDFIVNVLANTDGADSKFDAFGKKTKGTFDGIFGTVGKGGSAFSGFATVAGGALSAIGISRVGAEVETFLRDSVGAYKEAQASQMLLQDAYSRFPAVGDVTLGSLRTLNSALAEKTRFDDDATASGQAVLAQYQLTGKQITDLTPLLQDYAAKTGKDLPTAAEDLGKAMLGSGKTLKAVGIDFADAGSVGANFDQIMGGLRTQVGGFAEVEGAQAAGQSAILSNKLGEVQETLGAKLLPVITAVTSYLITDLVPALSGAANWFSENSELVGGLAIGIGVVTAAILLYNIGLGISKIAHIGAAGSLKGLTLSQWAFNAAAAANPIGLIVVAIGLLIAGIILLVVNWDVVSKWLTEAWTNTVNFAVAIWGQVAEFFTGLWAGIVGMFQAGVDWVVNLFLTWHPLGIIINNWGAIVSFFSDVWINIINIAVFAIGWVNGQIGLIGSGWNAMWGGLAGIVSGVFKNVQNFVAGGLNRVIDLVNGAIGGLNTLGALASSVTGGTVSWKIGKIPHIPQLAEGGIVQRATLLVAGEGRESEAVLPLSHLEGMLGNARRDGAASGNRQESSRSSSNGGGGGPIALEFHGDAAALEQLFTIYERKADGTRVLVSKMGKQRGR